MNRAFNGVYVREDDDQPTLHPDSVFQGPKLQEVFITKGIKRKLKGLNSSKAHGSY